MNNRRFFVTTILASIIGGLLVLAGMKFINADKNEFFHSADQNAHVRFSNFLQDSSFTVPAGLNFVYAAKVATPAVVHIKAFYSGSGFQQGNPYSNPLEDMLRDFFGEGNPAPQQKGNPNQPMPRSSGSGVIITADGYIATNNHVVENAERIEVTLDDKRTFTARVIGTDPNTDIAVIKIDEKDLAHLAYGNSDNVQVGEWVLAVGNPFNLTSTVTAGIVSAKGRNINILRDKNYGIEAFIQTDAAVNPGNSGGALVNLKGELIGINTAIATPTGTYAGYSFAVPASLVKKVVNDLKEYGLVQRALLGVLIRDVTAEVAKEYKLETLKGVLVDEVNEKSAAADAGLRKGDVILEVEGVSTNTVSALQEQVARHRPGDQVEIVYTRSGKTQKTKATLKNMEGETKITERISEVEIEGATFRDLNNDELQKLNVSGGVVLKKLQNGKWKTSGMKEGFIILRVDKNDVLNVQDFKRTMNNKKGGVLLEGQYENGEQAVYGIGW